MIWDPDIPRNTARRSGRIDAALRSHCFAAAQSSEAGEGQSNQGQ